MRFYKILTIESAYLLWTLRCERVIRNNDTPFSTVEVKNRWRKMIISRAGLDDKMTSRRLSKKALNKKLVRETWGDTCSSLHLLTQANSTNSGVLVGSRPESRSGVG